MKVEVDGAFSLISFCGTDEPLDRGLRAAPFPVAPTAIPAVETPAPLVGTSPACLLNVRMLLLKRTFGMSPFRELQTSHVGAPAWFLSGAFWICLQLAGVGLR